MVTNNRFKRLWRHWQQPSWRIKKQFPKADLLRLEQGIAASEAQHLGQIRFVIESNMQTHAVLRGQTPRQRAWQYFSSLAVWDTAYNTGVLLYIGYADHAVEIITDRGIDAKVKPEVWQDICQQLVVLFGQRCYQQGLEQALQRITTVLVEHIPRQAEHTEYDDVSNDVVLR